MRWYDSYALFMHQRWACMIFLVSKCLYACHILWLYHPVRIILSPIPTNQKRKKRMYNYFLYPEIRGGKRKVREYEMPFWNLSLAQKRYMLNSLILHWWKWVRSSYHSERESRYKVPGWAHVSPHTMYTMEVMTLVVTCPSLPDQSNIH